MNTKMIMIDKLYGKGASELPKTGRFNTLRMADGTAILFPADPRECEENIAKMQETYDSIVLPAKTELEFEVWHDEGYCPDDCDADAMLNLNYTDGTPVDLHTSMFLDLIYEIDTDTLGLDEVAENSYRLRDQEFATKEEFARAFEQRSGIKFSGVFEEK